VTLSWQDAAERVRLRRLVQDAIYDLSVPKGTGDEYNPNRVFDYAADIAAYPFRWQPGATGSFMEQVQPDDLGVCRVPGCGLPVRKLSPFVVARASYCADHLIEEGTETGMQRAVERSPEEALRVVALYLPGGVEALQSAHGRRRKPAKRIYTVNDKREVVGLYRSTPMQATEIARHLDIPEGTVKSWIKRHLEDPYFTKEEAA
jgi:hypothetical protein